MALADRYQADLADAQRSVHGYVLAGGVLEQLAAARKRVDATTFRPTAARAWVRDRTHPRDRLALVAVRAAVGGVDELSLVVRCGDRRLDGVRLQHGQATHDLETVVSQGELTRLYATVPPEVWTGEPWLVSVVAGGVAHRVVAPDRAALDVRAERPDDDWPPALVRDADGGVVVSGRRATVPDVDFRVRVGPATLSAQWTADSATEVTLTFAHDTSSGLENVAGSRDPSGRAYAAFDLTRLADRAGSWRVSVSGPDGPRPLRLPRGQYPCLDRQLDRRTVRVTRTDGVAVPVEVGYALDNQLTVRVGRVGPTTS